MHSKQRQIIDSHAFKHAFIQEEIINYFFFKKWFHDPLIQDLVRNYPLIQSFDMLIPCRSKVTFDFGTWSPAEARSWPFFTFWLPDEAKSRLFFDMLIPCKSKVTFDFGTWSPAEARSWPLFTFRLPTEASHNSSLICWPPAKARSHLILALDPLQKQGLGHPLLFNSLQKKSHNHYLLFDSLQKQSHISSLTWWSPAEARSHLILALDPLQKQGLGYCWTSCKSKVITFPWDVDPLQKKDLCFSFQHMMIPEQNQCLYLYLSFYFDNMIFFLNFSYYHVKLK